MGALTLFRSVLTVVAVLLLAYWCSRLLGKQWTIKTSGIGNLQIIEQIQVGQDRRILLLKAGEKHYLIGVSQAGIQLLTELEGSFEALQPPVPDFPLQSSFQDVLGKYLAGHQKKKGEDQ